MAVAAITHISASSNEGFQEAVKVAVDRAGKTLRGLQEARVVDQRAKVANGGQVAEYRVTIEVTFMLES